MPNNTKIDRQYGTGGQGEKWNYGRKIAGSFEWNNYAHTEKVVYVCAEISIPISLFILHIPINILYEIPI